jgi:hypothetical protein
VFTSFFAELEKIAGPHLVEYDWDPAMGGPMAGYVKKDDIGYARAAYPHFEQAIEKRPLPAGKSSVVMMPSRESLSRHFSNPKDMWHEMLRHENTHYLRDKAGKMDGMGQPGLRNVLRTIREEAIAYGKGGTSRHLSEAMKQKALQAAGANTVFSVRSAYAPIGGPAKGALAGRLGSALRAMRFIK